MFTTNDIILNMVSELTSADDMGAELLMQSGVARAADKYLRASMAVLDRGGQKETKRSI